MSNPNEQIRDAGAARIGSLQVAALVAILLIATVVRTLASTGDLWFDEVWTWMLLRDLDSPLDIFVMHHDNNHYLNSLYWFVVGDSPHALLYRVPSILFGVATVLVGARLAAVRGWLEGLIVAFLLSSSFLLILYSSEARGYSAVTFFAFAAFAAMRRLLATPSTGLLVGFWGLSILGFLSHLSYGLVAAAIGLWTMAELARPGTRALAWFTGLARFHAVPFVFLVLLYWIDVSKVPYLFVHPDPFGAVLADAIAHTLRMPAGVAPNWAAASVALLMMAVSIFRIARSGSREWIFFVAVLVSAPLLYGIPQLFMGPVAIMVRYFLVSFVFALLLLAYVFADLVRSGRIGTVVSAGVLGMLLVGNAQLTEELLSTGRGGYRQALQDIADHSLEDVVTVTSDHDLENGVLVYYNAGHLDTTKQIAYVRKKDQVRMRPHWYIAHAYNRAKVPKDAISVGPMTYKLVATYPASPYSGFPWFVYELSDFDASKVAGERLDGAPDASRRRQSTAWSFPKTRS